MNNKKIEYKLGICGRCEKAMLLSKEPLTDYKKRVKKLKGKSISRFDHNEMIPVKRLCDCPIDHILSVPYTEEKAKEFLVDNP